MSRSMKMHVKQYVTGALLCGAGFAQAQTPLPWGAMTSIPVLAAKPGVALFYVASYTSNYTPKATHTDYDLARKDADAFLKAHPTTPTYVILNPSRTQTCDDAPLPVVSRGNGTSATVSILGYGAGLSTIQKRSLCAAQSSTLLLNRSSAPVTDATFQGFNVDANHVDQAACGFYGVSNSLFFNLSCGNAIPGADHEVEFGDATSLASGRNNNDSIYDLQSYDSVGIGKGALLTPVWDGTALSGVSVGSEGIKAYTQRYTRAQLIGPGLSSCSIVPTLTPTVSSTKQVAFSVIGEVTYGYVTGATVTNQGHCTSTSNIYILVQDGPPIVSGMKFSNITSSHAWALEATGSTFYGELWLANSAFNSAIGEHPYSNQNIQIAEYGNGNGHTNTLFDGPGEFGAALYGTYGSFHHATFSWDTQTYQGASGYWIGSTASKWQISNSQCTDSTPDFVAITTRAGSLSNTATAPYATKLNDIQACDGTKAVLWPTSINPL